MPLAYLVTWTESERGWGQRPDGHSLHLSPADYAAYYEEYRKKLPAEAPNEYSYPEPGILAVEVPDELYDKLRQGKGSLRYWNGALICETGVTGARSAREKAPEPPKPFMQLAVEGLASPEDLDDYIDRWHGATEGSKSLQEYLGMTQEEYTDYIQDPNLLYKALYNRTKSR